MRQYLKPSRRFVEAALHPKDNVKMEVLESTRGAMWEVIPFLESLNNKFLKKLAKLKKSPKTHLQNRWSMGKRENG